MRASLPDDPVVYLIAMRSLAPEAFFERTAAALRAGVGIVQMREKGLARPRALEHGHRLRDLAHEHGALFIVNDDPELAVALRADGVHVGQDDMAPAAVRAITGPEMLVGLSTHDGPQAAAAADQPVDMIGVGPVYATTTKAAGDAVGTELLRRVAALGGPVPFPIGGITAENAGELARAGMRRAAVASYVLASPDPAGAVTAILEALD